LTISHDPSSVPTADDEHISEEEKLKNNNVLSNLLSGFDFNEVTNAVDSDEAEEFGFNAKEQQEENYGQYNNDNNYNDEEYYNENGDDYNYNNNNYKEEKDYYNEEPVKSHKQDNNKNHTYEEEEIQEEEPIPIFTDKPVNNVMTGTVSNTETLRSLFNPESESKSTGFTLMAGIGEDIADDQNIPEDAEEHISSVVGKDFSVHDQLKEKNHLFFAHFISPFLLGQTQLTKISSGGNNELLNNWDQEFWDNRGTWTREMKNKKRDALRQLHKKKAKESNHILI